MGFFNRTRTALTPLFVVTAVLSLNAAVIPLPLAEAPSVAPQARLGVLKGVIRDVGGEPIANAAVGVFRLGTSRLIRQVRSSSDGSYLLRIVPGKYTVMAVAQGFNPVTLPEVTVGSSSEINYGFNLVRAGSGNTLPEQRADRNNPKWVRRSASLSRSIYQHGDSEEALAEIAREESFEIAENRGERSRRPIRSIAESFVVSSPHGNYMGMNVATLLPLGDKAEMVIAGQGGLGENAPQRVEHQINFRPSGKHQVRLRTSVGQIGSIAISEKEDSVLGQVSFQALDEWRVREGVVLVLGFDYSKFFGAGGDFAFSPRLGVQFDVDAKTRFRSAYTTQTEERTWSRAIEFEDSQVLFREPVAMPDIALVEGQPVMSKSRRFEIGVERVLDNRSSIEANAFFDTTVGRGIGMTAMPFDGAGTAINEFIGAQEGGAHGLSLVYSRRIGTIFNVAGGYSFGSGQKLSAQAISNPGELFQTDFFQTVFGQFEADLRSGTSVRTVFRLSPQATVFAIDPFRGRLAIYDPSLSILVTQHLPTLGLPFQAEAVVDARNLFDFQSGVASNEGSLKLNSFRRSLRGGILVRF